PPTLGGLSGCSYSEGVSWGKFASKKEGGEFAEIYCDYTMVLPWIVRSLQDRFAKTINSPSP
ncbi:MAG: deoxyhypusine synthase family protein, partial [Nitrospinota bacterium]